MPQVNYQPIALTLTDGTVALMQFALSERGEHSLEPSRVWPCTPRAVDAVIAKAAISEPALAGATWRLLLPMEIPQDNTFKYAWRDTGSGALEHDMAVVRTLHMNRLRQHRTPLLEGLDRDFTIAQGRVAVARGLSPDGITTNKEIAEAEVERLEGKREDLRLMPETLQPMLDAATTIDEVKAVTIDLI